MRNQLLLYFTFCLLHFTFSTSAQYDVSKINKKAVESYTKGIEKAQDGKFADAIESLQEAINRDPKYIDAYLSLAGVYGQIKNRTQSVATYEKAFTIDSNYTSDYRLPYSINLAGVGEFEKALATINALLSRNNLSPNTRKAATYRQKTYQFAIDYAKNESLNNYVFQPNNLGEGVNTSESEYFPSLPIDGKALIFTRRIKNFNEDFFISEENTKGWETAKRLNGSINTDENEGAQMISQDGQWLVFTGC